MKKLQSVEPFKYTYRVLNRITMQVRGDYKSLAKVFESFSLFCNYRAFFREEISDGYDTKIAHYTVNGKVYLWHPNAPESQGKYAIIRVEDGYVLRQEDINDEDFPPRRKRYYRGEDETIHDRSKDLVKTKSNNRKIKADWASKLRPAHWSYGPSYHEEYYYSCANMGYHRLGKMIREQRVLEGIIDEYENEYPNIVRASRKGLPSGWSGEKGISAYHSAASWKHHSKRRKQWIPK